MRLISKEQKGSLYAISSGLSYGLLGYFGISIINADLSVANMLFWRFLISSSLIAMILIFQRKTINENFKEIFKGVFYGTAFYSTSSITYFVASQYIGTGLSMVIVFTYPALVMFLNWLLYRSNVTRTYYFAITIIMIGMVLLADINKPEFDILGISLAILSAILYACYIVFSNKNKLSPLVSTLMVSIGCTLTCLAFAFIDNSFILPEGLYLWINLLAMGIICTALPILLLLEGFKYISTAKASILSVLEPVFVVIFGVILLGETIYLLKAIGIIMVLLGALLTLFTRSSE